MYYDKVNVDKVKLTYLTLNEDECGYYLSAQYRVEDNHSIRELEIPKIRLGIRPDSVAIRQEGDGPYMRTSVNLGFGYCWMDLVENDLGKVYFTEKVIEENTHEMTLDEIEKKLGYKVKIVNK
jgi:hypothetical protein